MTEDLLVTIGLLTVIYLTGFWISSMLDLPTHKIIYWPLSLTIGTAKTLRAMIWTDRK